MAAVFASTFYWVASTDPDDALYEQAASWRRALSAFPLLLQTKWSPGSFAFFSAHPWTRLRAVQTVQAFGSEPDTRTLPQSREPSQAGFELYAARLDKRYRLADCISMPTMRREGSCTY